MHIALIPAREGSKGFRHKNRIFFANTADFIDSVHWFDNVIVSTDDPVIVEYAGKRGYTVHNRSAELSGPAVSIKTVLENAVKEQNLELDTNLWLFYLPILYKRTVDFTKAKQIIEEEEVASLCSFIPAHNHPYNCWRYDNNNNELEQYIPNDIFRRQDLSPAWMHYHYLCCLRISELPNLNSELINKKTRPVFLNRETADQLIEIDTPEDYAKWQKINTAKQESTHE
jgi:CMP-N-acetylneuraminic acid synthetase